MNTGNSSSPQQKGIALIIVMLALTLFTILSLGVHMMVTSETQTAGNEAYNTQAFYAASAGLEKLTSDLDAVYTFKTVPDSSDFSAIMSGKPTIPNYSFTEYGIYYNGASQVRNIPSGPFEGLVSLLQPYKLLVTALDGTSKSEVRLRRDFLNNLIPLFQFGAFYDGDLEAHAGPVFTFEGRVHTNGDFYVAAGNTTTFKSRVTVVG